MKKDSLNKRVLDSQAVVAYLEDEPAAAKVEPLLMHGAEGRARLFMSVVNWGEALYILERRRGPGAIEQVQQFTEQMGIEVVETSKDLVLQAAHYKARKKMSYPDCFAAALAKRLDAPLVTGDGEFKEVEKDISIIWL